jgi:hypothetical protein
MRALSVVCGAAVVGLAAVACQDSVAPDRAVQAGRVSGIARAQQDLEVSAIMGPSGFSGDGEVDYYVTASEGDPPYSYQWTSATLPFTGSTTDSIAYIDLPCQYSTTHQSLSVTVSDAGHDSITVSKDVTVYKNSGGCP